MILYWQKVVCIGTYIIINDRKGNIPFPGGNEMFEKIKNLLVEELSVKEEDITMSAELVNDLGINSLELADLVLLCEEKFDIEIGDDDIHKFVTVGDVVDYLSTKAED